MTASPPPSRSTDPWAAFGRVSGGVLVYGAIGFALDQWWGTSFCVAIGVVLGAALGTWTVFRSLPEHASQDASQDQAPPTTGTRGTR